MVRRRWGAAVAALLLLGGCGSDPEPRFEAEPTPTAAGTPSESASPAAETADAFIRRWFDASTAMQATNDSAAFESLSTGCIPCTTLVTTVAGYYEAGGSINPAEIEILDVRRQKSSSDYLVTTRSGRTAVQKSASDPVQQLKGGPVTYRVRLSGSPGAWLMQDYFVEPTA